MSSGRPPHDGSHGTHVGVGLASLALGALGIVYGDIGTSPLYAFRETFEGHDLAVTHGVHATDSFSVRVADLSLIGEVMGRLREQPPTEVAGVAVARTDDLSRGDGGLPPTDGLRYLLVLNASQLNPRLRKAVAATGPFGTVLRGLKKL